MRGAWRRLLICLAFLSAPAAACFAEDGDAKLIPTESETLFLDRLMLAESGGRRYAKNAASSALGPFQFLGTTFLDVVRRNLPALASGKTDAQILALRTDYQTSRDAALLYTRENAAALAARGSETSAANLRLAFFAGASGAIRVLEAGPDEPVSRLLSDAAISANPFLRGMTASGLLAKVSREADGAAMTIAALPRRPSPAGGILIHCKMGLASCRHWVALAEKRAALTAARFVAPPPKQ